MDKKQKLKTLALFILIVFPVGFGWTFFLQHQNQKTEKQTSEEVVAPLPSVSNENAQVESNPEQDETEEAAAQEAEPSPAPEESKKAAEQFINTYYIENPDDPMAYIENSKGLMTEDLYQEEKERVRRPTLTRQETKIKDMETFKVETGTDEVVWNVIINGEAKDSSGKAHAEEMWYWVGMVEEDGNWKVARVGVENE